MMIHEMIEPYLNLDSLSFIMLILVAFIGACVGSFTLRYLKGDSRYRLFYFELVALLVSVMLMISANHLLLFFAAWCGSNAILVKMMIHKPNWLAAKSSGLLAAKYYVAGAAFLGLAFIILFLTTGTAQINQLGLSYNLASPYILSALILILLAAMTQSASWPFHRWLISSLNSPTPVSAIMHAGLVNGGGILIIRFAPLYLEQSHLLNLIFVIGLVSALLGTLWKLMQSDIKRMLACSTMSQIGFMLVQCGLGLFSAAIAHLVSHSLFKAYLFLISASAAQEKRMELHYPPKLACFLIALGFGALGSVSFAVVTNKSVIFTDTTSILILVAFITVGQFALTLLQEKTNILTVFISSVMCGIIYGISVSLISFLVGDALMKPQPLNVIHIAACLIMVFSWIAVLFFRSIKNGNLFSGFILRTYVMALNASQPDPATVTTVRQNYKY